MQEKNHSTRQYERNNSTQQEKTTQLCTAVDRLQPPAPPLQQNRLFLPTSVYEKTIQLAPSTRKSKPMQEKNNSTRQHERNNSTQQEKTTQPGNMNETTQLSSRNEITQQEKTTQLVIAVDRLQPPAPPLQQNRLSLLTHEFK
ncbi:hypothetical protein TNCV_2082311 [Trichonephila clavipes]|nr:hypothetical protein TNCV_2082311 [Trichonephila clavipes]